MKNQEQIEIQLKNVNDQVLTAKVDSEQNQLFTHQPIDLSFQNVKYSILSKDKKGQAHERVILDDISGICKSGECTAIMGSSGAGKTSLLNILAKRIEKNKNIKLEGQIHANKVEYTYDDFPNFATYVMQDDRLFESMTVKEVFQFACNLKMKGSQQIKNQRLEEMIKQMRLERARNTFIGGEFVKGISGGERKRVSIGFELICEPQVVMLDEPTSGLDSFTAFLLILSLKKYSEKGNTVVFTIHQPSSDIWNMFDRIILMVKGQLVYQGPGQAQVLSYFDKQGFVCSKEQNPADYYMFLMQDNDENSQKIHQKLFDNYNKDILQVVTNQIQQRQQNDLKYKIIHNGFFYGVGQVAKRTFLNIFRNPMLFIGRIFQNIFLSLFTSAIYYQLSREYETNFDMVGLLNMVGFLYFHSIGQFMESAMPNVLTFPLERGVFLKEYNLKMYSISSYFVGKNLPEFPINFLMPLICSSIVYWLVGLRDEAQFFFQFYFISFLLSLCGSSVGILIGTIFSSTKVSSEAAPVFIVPFMLFGGFYSNSNSIKEWSKWLENFSPFKFGLEAFASNEFSDLSVQPDPIELFGFKYGYWKSVLALICLFLGYRLISLIALWKNTKKLQ